MKKILLLLSFIFTVTSSAQYAIVSAVDLIEGTENDNLQTEKFWGPLHKKAIEDDNKFLSEQEKIEASESQANQ